MRKNLPLLLLIFLCLSGLNSGAQTAKTVGGAGANYSTLKQAFDAINAGTVTGAITLKITGSTSETASSVLNATGSGNASYSSILIYPTASGFVIGGSIANPLISLAGASNVTIDGRVNQSGAADLTTRNTNTISTVASTLSFSKSAVGNTIRYLNINGSCIGSGSAVIVFSTSTTGNGNDNNIIEYCSITNSGGNRPVNTVLFSGSTNRENSGNIIRNNNFFDFLNPASGSYGILFSSNSVDNIVSGNSFYETTAFAPQGANTYNPIRLSLQSKQIISGNYIGGSAPQCAGNPWIINASVAHYFCAIFASGGATVPTVIQNNVIRNINYSSVEDNPWDGIFINAGNVDVAGNIIGDSTGTGSIVVTTPLPSATATISGGVVTGITLAGGGAGYTRAPAVTFSTSGSTTSAIATATIDGTGKVTGIIINSGGVGYTGAPNVVFDGQTNGYSTSHGILIASSGTVNILDNSIGSITTVSSAYYSHGFEAVYVRGVTGTLNINNNLIGSRSTANSIQTSSTASSSLQKQDVYGIYSSGLGTTTISGNTIANLHNGYTGTNSGARARGITTTSGSNTITNNTVRDISSASSQTSTRSSATVIGICQTANTAGLSQKVDGNIISNLRSTNSTARVDVYGIYFTGSVSGQNSVSGNYVHGITLSSSAVLCEIDGIVLFSGATSCSNNIINLGAGVGIGCKINGIWDEGSTGNTANIWFNTIYICGNVTTPTTSATAAIWDAANASTRNYRNNILFNARSGGTTGKHYAIVLSGISNTIIDNNDYYVAGTNGVPGRFGAADKTTFAAWKLSTGQDVNSLNIDPGFQFAGGTFVTNYYAAAGLPAFAGTGVMIDYEGITRSSMPKMGALESNRFIWQGSISSDFATAGNWSGNVVPADGSDITFSIAPSNHCILDQNRTVGVITNSQSAYSLKVNGFQLTLNGQTAFTNGANIDATASGSRVVFAGTSALDIPSGTFENSTVDALTINNNAGITLHDNLTVNSDLDLNMGAFILGEHTLNILGTITIGNGTLSGGDSTNIYFGGSGQTTSLPAISVNNLTIDRRNDIYLAGDVNVGGTLTLTDGTLVLGAHKLNLAGASPVRTNGSIDAGNAGADLILGGDLPVTIAASTFIGRINNVTFNNTSNGTANINIATPLTINGYAEFTSGIVNFTDNGALLFSDSATCSGGSDNSFVNGTVSKTGSGPFTFPVGAIGTANEKIWAPLKISAPGQASDQFSCTYYFTPPPEYTNPDAICDPSMLEQTSSVEYWDLQRISGTSTPDVTLFWKDASRSGISDSSRIVVAHYGDCDGVSKWEAMTKVSDPVNEPNGSVTGTGFTSYSPLTFGIKTEGNPLPIELLSFSATCTDDQVSLNWATATESNNDFFTIERSQDAINWEIVAREKGSGNSSHVLVYTAKDEHPTGETAYYRLKQTDYDGKYEYFAPVVTECGTGNEAVTSYYPNPFSTELLVNIGLLTNDRGSVEAFDAQGKRVFTRLISGSDLNNGKLVLNLTDLPSGIYFMEFKTGNTSSSTKIIKK